MSTTLVNVGILNGRSSKLDSDDLYSLCELIEKHPTEQASSTPEIVAADTLAQRTFPLPAEHQNARPGQSESVHEPASVRQRSTKGVKETFRIDADHAQPLPNTIALTETTATDRSHGIETAESELPNSELDSSTNAATEATDSQSPAVDLTEKRFDLDKVALLKSLGITSPGTEPATRPVETDAAVGSQLAAVSDVSTALPGNANPPKSRLSAGQIIERAKQAAIETAMLAASNSAAMLRTKLPKPAAHKALLVENVATEQVAYNSDETGISSDRLTDANDAVSKSAVESSVNALHRNNLRVEEISADLADRLEQQSSFVTSGSKANAKTIAILPPTEKQYERLVDNLLDKTVPGMPSAMLISSCDTESKSGSIATGIAALLAERDLGRVLLVDGNLQEKSLTDSLTDSHDAGLGEVLNRQQTISETIVSTGMNNLFFLPAGIEPASREKSMGTRLAALSDELRDEFRFVIIDGGLAAESVSRTWSSFCEATYLVITTGSTNTAAATRAVSQLQSSGARLLGCVVAK